ncbi:MAG: glycosyltransferase family 39 protein [Candidatus Omnitrophota bacterium]
MFNLIKSNSVNLALFAVLLIAAVARYWGINFGLPNIHCRGDEMLVVHIALNFGTGDFNPHFFEYPTFYMYTLFFIYCCYFLVGIILGKYASLSDFISEIMLTPSNFHLIDRLFVAFLGTLTVFIVYKIAKHLFDKRTAIISSLFLCLSYLHVRDSHFGTVDIPTAFLIMCSVLFIVKSYKIKRLRDYILAGVFAGLATSTKYAGIFLVMPMFFVHFFNISDKKGKMIKSFLDKSTLSFIFAFLSAFLVGTPFVVFDFSKFIFDFMHAMTELQTGYLLILGRGWWYHLKFSLFHGLGWSLFLAALLGIVVLFKLNMRKAIILFSYPFCYYLFAGSGYKVFLRYAIPLIPFLCITAAVFTVYIGSKLSYRLPAFLKNIAIFIVAILFTFPSIRNIICFDRLLARKDVRLIAEEWINKNVKTGSIIYQTGVLWGQLQLPMTHEAIKKMYNQRPPAEKNSRYFNAKIDYSIKKNMVGYEEWIYDSERDKFKFFNEEKANLLDYIIMLESPLIYTWVPEKIQKLLKTSYSLNKFFKVIDADNKHNLFDRLDAFYVPFTGFKDVQRPGPNIYIYSRNDIG